MLSAIVTSKYFICVTYLMDQSPTFTIGVLVALSVPSAAPCQFFFSLSSVCSAPPIQVPYLFRLSILASLVLVSFFFTSIIRSSAWACGSHSVFSSRSSVTYYVSHQWSQYQPLWAATICVLPYHQVVCYQLVQVSCDSQPVCLRRHLKHIYENPYCLPLISDFSPQRLQQSCPDLRVRKESSVFFMRYFLQYKLHDLFRLQ